MAKVKVVLTGDDELNRKLAALTNQQAREAIKKAARPALKPCLQTARRVAPKRSGKLRRSIKIRAIARSRSRIGARVTTSASDNVYSGKTFYGGFQEWGWRVGKRTSNADFGADKGKRRTIAQRLQATARNNTRKKIPGLNFLKKSANSTREECMYLYQTSIKDYIEKVAKG